MNIRTILAAAVAVAVVAESAAQQTPTPPPQRPDFSKAEVKVTDLGNRTFMLEGVGGNITVAAGDDAVIMIDAQFAPLHDKIKAAVDAATKLPIRYVVNTHFHGDHTGGNAGFASDGAVITAQANVRRRLAEGTIERFDRWQDAAGHRRGVANQHLHRRDDLEDRRPRSPISNTSPMPTPMATPTSTGATPTCCRPAIRS